MKNCADLTRVKGYNICVLKNHFSAWKQADLWWLWGNRGNKWQNAMVSLYGPDTAGKTSRIVISAIRGWDYSGDIAIDDIQFHNCDFKDVITPCQETFPKCNDQPITRPTLGA